MVFEFTFISELKSRASSAMQGVHRQFMRGEKKQPAARMHSGEDTKGKHRVLGLDLAFLSGEQR